MAYVYRHIRLDKNMPFYIGIGNDVNYKRANSINQRTAFWQSIAANGYEVEILFDNLSWEQACKKEKEFIKLYGRKDNKTGILCNMTDGGEGAYGRKMKPESIEKLKQLNKNKKGVLLSETHKNNIKQGIKNMLNSDKGISFKEKISKANKGKWIGRLLTDEQKEKISKSLTGKKQSEETKAKRSAAMMGKPQSDIKKAKLKAAATGRKHTEISKEKMSQAAKNRTFSEETREKLRQKTKQYWQLKKNAA